MQWCALWIGRPLDRRLKQILKDRPRRDLGGLIASATVRTASSRLGSST